MADYIALLLVLCVIWFVLDATIGDRIRRSRADRQAMKRAARRLERDIAEYESRFTS